MSRQRHTGGTAHGGFSLIEVLVSVTVLVVALLPVFGAFRAVLQGGRHARAALQAATLLETQLAELCLAHRGGVAPVDVRAATLALPDGSRWYWQHRVRDVPETQAPAANGRSVRLDGRIDALEGGVSAAGSVRLWIGGDDVP